MIKTTSKESYETDLNIRLHANLHSMTFVQNMLYGIVGPDLVRLTFHLHWSYLRLVHQKSSNVKTMYFGLLDVSLLRYILKFVCDTKYLL